MSSLPYSQNLLGRFQVAYCSIRVQSLVSPWPPRECRRELLRGESHRICLRGARCTARVRHQREHANGKKRPTSETSYRSESRAASARLSKNPQPEVCTQIESSVLVIIVKSLLYCLPVSSTRRCRGGGVLPRTSSCMSGSCVADMRPIFGGRWCSPFDESAKRGPLNPDANATAAQSAWPTPPSPVTSKFLNCTLSEL
jgi:hypothetical protein